MMQEFFTPSARILSPVSSSLPSGEGHLCGLYGSILKQGCAVGVSWKQIAKKAGFMCVQAEVGENSGLRTPRVKVTNQAFAQVATQPARLDAAGGFFAPSR